MERKNLSAPAKDRGIINKTLCCREQWSNFNSYFSYVRVPHYLLIVFGGINLVSFESNKQKIPFIVIVERNIFYFEYAFHVFDE